MKQTIKPIETEYNGYRFRSRLEARWAVFFDALKVEYQYELEGFDLYYNGKYLPDFFLPKSNAFIEVKPTYKNTELRLDLIDHVASLKAIELSLANKLITIIAFDDPLNHRSIWFENGLVKYPCCAIGFNATKEIWPTHYSGEEIAEHVFEYSHKTEAIIARQARFEYGEKG